tara:strand:- start:219 stop:1196 length:978 start_codon:yes stop_codon:yes gene_type:complete
MKICIFGGGSIGGLLAVNLEKIGINVSVIARGQHLEVMKKNGLTLINSLGEETSFIVNCTDDPNSLGIQDYLFITIKSPALLPSLENLKPLVGKNTTIITCMNGIPHWYFHKLDNKYANYKITCLDADLLIDSILPPDNIVGSVVYPACEIVKPGTIKHIAGNRFSLGEPDGSESDRLKFISEILKKAGFRAPIQKNIRDEIWLKLIGNLSFNPISALTGATLEQICNDQGTEQIVKEMMIEAKTIAEKLGAKINMSIEKRIDGARKVGAHKTSMLQDIEAGKPIEIDSIIVAVKELGELTNSPTPKINTILNLTIQKAKLIGCL